MADFDGEYISDTNRNTTSSLPTFEVLATGNMDVSLITRTNSGTANFELTSVGWYSQMDPLVVVTNHYHKRGWRTESSAYVDWETTDRNTPYPGGGTVEPAVGTVVYQWTTYSNGQVPA